MCADIVVLSEKIRCPAPRGLVRERLIQPLVGPEALPTALVVALAGAGKTTLMAQAAARMSRPVVWYRATPEDESADALVKHLGHALRCAGLSRQPMNDIEQLLAAVDGARREIAIVVDDLHEIRGTPAEAVLERFVQLRPQTVRVVMGSRSPPSFNLTRLLVSDMVVEIGNEDLRFRSWEVEQLLRQIYGEPLPPEAVAILARKVGGWAAGLQLFHLATANKSPAARRDAVHQLDGRYRLIRSYLATNVLDALAADTRRFLTRTCTLGRLTAPLCDSLLGISGSDVILADLERTQLFTAVDGDGTSYRYHQVLQDHLEVALLEELGARLARLQYARSGSLLEAAGASHDALRAFARAEDWPAVARVLRQTRSPVGQASAMPWEQLIPARLGESDPWFAIAEARHFLRRGILEEALTAYRRAEALLTDDSPVRGQFRMEHRLVKAWSTGHFHIDAEGSAAGLPHWSLRVRAATRHTRRNSARRGKSPSSPGVGECLADGVCALLSGDLPSAADDFTTAAAQAERGSFEGSAALLGDIVTQLVMAAPTEPLRKLDAAILSAEFDSHEWLAGLAGSIHAAVRRAHERGPLIADASMAVTSAPTGANQWGAALHQLAMGVANECAGVSGAAALDDAYTRFGALDAQVLQAWAAACAALGEARRGHPPGRRMRVAADEVRRSGSRGAQAILAAAAALSEHGPRRREAVSRAEGLGGECGFDVGSLLGQGTRGRSAGLTSVDCAPVVRLRCFGGFELSVGSVVAEWGTVRPRARALLHLLALSAGHDVHRELLIEWLWPGQPVRSATRSLQVAVSSLRQALEDVGLRGADVLIRRGDAYRVVLPPNCSADVVDLPEGLRRATAAAARGELVAAVELRRAALNLYRGDLLPEDGPAEWVVEERERFRLLAASAALELARDACRLGDMVGGARAAHTSVRLNPFSDEAWRVLSIAHQQAGNTAEALWAHREHLKVIARLSEPDPSLAVDRNDVTQPSLPPTPRRRAEHGRA